MKSQMSQYGSRQSFFAFLKQANWREWAHQKRARLTSDVISATNANLSEEVAQGRFREDLLFRLNTVEIHLPPLRDRREDIPQLAGYFLSRYSTRYRKPLQSFSPKTLEIMLAYKWPGNVRELDHATERAVLLARGNQIEPDDLGLVRRATSKQDPSTR